MASASNSPALAFPKFTLPEGFTPEISEAVFRQKVWDRDKGRNRANGELLCKSGEEWRFLGDVCHLVTKGAHPELKLVVSNAVLLSREYHILSDARGNYRLRLLDPDSGKPATNANRPILFVMRDLRGRELWRRLR